MCYPLHYRHLHLNYIFFLLKYQVIVCLFIKFMLYLNKGGGIVVQTETVLNSKTQKMALKSSIIAYWIILCCGIVLLTLYFVDRFVLGGHESSNLYLGIIFIVFAILMLFYFNSIIKSANNREVTNRYEFAEGYFKVTIIRKSEIMGTIKYYYDDLVSIRENKEFIALKVNQAAAFIVIKQNILNDDLVQLRQILKLKVKE